MEVAGAFTNCFYNCELLSGDISEILFNKITTETTIDLTSTFYNCKSLTGIVNPGLTYYNTIANSNSHSDCFYNCININNYRYIPTSWGGLGE